MKESWAVASAESPQVARQVVTMPSKLCQSMLRRADELHNRGLKAFGVLTGHPSDHATPYSAVDAVFFDASNNRRNDPHYRSAFRAQGNYFREYEDAGFVADPRELLQVWRTVERAGQEVIAPFHIHRRQPANFSMIDYRLHNPAFAWHLIVSLSEPGRPVLQPFSVKKSDSEFGINADDDLEHSEQSYDGPEVRPMTLVVRGGESSIRQLIGTLSPPPESKLLLGA